MITQCYDMVILGAGVAGLGLARSLSTHRLRVMVISYKKAGEASPRAAGILDPFLEIKSPSHPLLSLNLKAFEEFSNFARQIQEDSGRDPGYRKLGMIYYGFSPFEKTELTRRFTWQKRTPIQVQKISADLLQIKEPASNFENVSALFYPSFGRVLARDFMQALRKSCEKKGVHILEAFQEPHWIKAGNQIKSVIANGRRWTFRSCVDARGSWAGQFAPTIRKPIEPVRGQILIVRLKKTKIQHILHTLTGGYVVPWHDNLYLIGSTIERAGFRPQVTGKGIQDIFKEVTRLVPNIQEGQILQKWAGLRPSSEDGLPLIGSTSIKNLYLCAGLYRSGILLGGYVGKLLANGLLTGRMPSELNPFSPLRLLSSRAVL